MRSRSIEACKCFDGGKAAHPRCRLDPVVRCSRAVQVLSDGRMSRATEAENSLVETPHDMTERLQSAASSANLLLRGRA